jgi:hypothetical protein
MRAPPWWDAARTPIASLVAPLAVPILAAVYLGPPFDLGVSLVIVVSWFVAYVGVFVFGLPINRFLLARNETTFWIAPAVGFVVGVTILCVAGVLVGLMFGVDLSSIVSGLARRQQDLAALQLGGPAGAAVGAVFWLIARPDLRAHACKDRGQRA